MSNSPNKIITLQELINAQVDAYKLELIMNEAPWVEITTRLGRKCYSIATIIAIIEQFQLDTQSALSDLQDAIAQIVEGGVPDLAVATWSGRTQADKNKENISAQDYGANGNGVADDTAAFVALEAAYQGRVIDLLGKNYKVTRSFTLNKYVNGVFIIGDLVANKKPEQSKLSIDMGLLGQDSSSYLYQLIRYGTGASSVVQSVVVDEVNNYAYTMVLTSEQTTETINRLDLRDGNRLIEKDKYVFSNLGHQGMTLEYTVDGSSRLWVSASVGGKAYRTLYDPVAPVQEEYILMDNTGTSTNPFISADQRFLCARSQVTIDGNSHLQIHVFDLAHLVENGAGDYRGKELYKFSARYEIDGELSISSQGLACDGEFIYIIGGSSGLGMKNSLVVFDFFGNQVAINEDVKIGNAMAQTIGTGTFIERESLFWHNINGVQTLCNNIVMGDIGGRENYVYALNKINDRPVVSYSMNDKPCFSACSNSDTSLHYSVAGNLSSNRDLNLGWTYRGAKTLYLTLNGDVSKLIGNLQIDIQKTPTEFLDVYYGETRRGNVWSSSTNFGIRAHSGASLVLSATDGNNENEKRWKISSTTGDFYPDDSGVRNLGSSSRLIKDIFATNGVIQTSDERLKQQFRSLSDREKDAALEIKSNICLFKFNDAVDLKGDGARWHVGVKAQQVISIMESHNLNWQEYGFICFDEWDEKPEEIETWDDEFNEEGDLIRAAGSEVVQKYREAGSRYAVRYEELSMFIWAAI